MAVIDLERAREIVCRDLSSEFLRTVSIIIAWEYSELYEMLRRNSQLTNELRNEEFGKRRGLCAVNALTKAAHFHGVSFEFRRLDCNGQQKLLIRAGRVILLQEPILTLTDAPRVSDYKRELAEAHGFIGQLELDLGDRPLLTRDWSGSILAVLLHGSAGATFTRAHKALGGLMLAVPDDAYNQWTLRVDLHQLAMLGHGLGGPISADETTNQLDQVNVTIRKDKKRRIGE